MRNNEFTSTARQPVGRVMGRSLHPLDAQNGWPATSVEVHSPGRPLSLDAQKEALKAKAVEAAKARAKARAENRNAFDALADKTGIGDGAKDNTLTGIALAAAGAVAVWFLLFR